MYIYHIGMQFVSLLYRFKYEYKYKYKYKLDVLATDFERNLDGGYSRLPLREGRGTPPESSSEHKCRWDRVVVRVVVAERLGVSKGFEDWVGLQQTVPDCPSTRIHACTHVRTYVWLCVGMNE